MDYRAGQGSPAVQTSPEKGVEKAKGSRNKTKWESKRWRCPRLGLRTGEDVSEEKAWEMAISCLLGHGVEASEPWPPRPLLLPFNHRQQCATSIQKEAAASLCPIQDAAYDQW